MLCDGTRDDHLLWICLLVHFRDNLQVPVSDRVPSAACHSVSISWDVFNTGKCNRSNIIIACSTDYNDVCSYVASISSTSSPTVAVGAMLEQLVPLHQLKTK